MNRDALAADQSFIYPSDALEVEKPFLRDVRDHQPQFIDMATDQDRRISLPGGWI